MSAVYAARVLRPWGEGRGDLRDGSPAQQGDATFLSARHGEASWELPGALGESDVADWESRAACGDNWPGWVVFDVTRSVRDFLTTPSLNHGWKISPDPIRGVSDCEIDYPFGCTIFKSSDSPDLALRPMLVLTPREGAAETSPSRQTTASKEDWELDRCAENFCRLDAALARSRSLTFVSGDSFEGGLGTRPVRREFLPA
jgi:hypothetical protein